uniref:Uncharacterized protein n=1 Tax=Chromera velia CCMP2878 TaxID=1169474 RepID=A0A0G4HI82_9ALVE|eukprot:Cvel_27836.t1-p1 / transcript=Cvel_27836.t1 / gene=Cvel_27836 / organism=Chromera_velia_CCMP2878 / gene_product=hypothetical protein / transcript_product=hypothetical protein / location=Cvel_scaffold3539:7904-9460(+) / protein_length=389 / sequence_SO=supercontig / SO=protein_coding / is_pseudo=false
MNANHCGLGKEEAGSAPPASDPSSLSMHSNIQRQRGGLLEKEEEGRGSEEGSGRSGGSGAPGRVVHPHRVPPAAAGVEKERYEEDRLSRAESTPESVQSPNSYSHALSVQRSPHRVVTLPTISTLASNSVHPPSQQPAESAAFLSFVTRGGGQSSSLKARILNAKECIPDSLQTGLVDEGNRKKEEMGVGCPSGHSSPLTPADRGLADGLSVSHAVTEISEQISNVPLNRFSEGRQKGEGPMGAWVAVRPPSPSGSFTPGGILPHYFSSVETSEETVELVARLVVSKEREAVGDYSDQAPEEVEVKTAPSVRMCLLGAEESGGVPLMGRSMEKEMLTRQGGASGDPAGARAEGHVVCGESSAAVSRNGEVERERERRAERKAAARTATE